MNYFNIKYLKNPVFYIIALPVAIAVVYLAVSNEGASVKGSVKNNEEYSKKQLVSVMVQPVVFSANDRVFEAIGTARAKRSVDIYPAVDDRVEKVLFKSQDKVKEGAVLVELDDREEVLQLQLAKVKLEDAKRLLERYEEAVKEGAVPQSEVDSARADVDSAKVGLDQAVLDIEDRKVIAPFSGVVGIPRIDPGDRIERDTLITGLDDRTTIYLDFEVPESLVGMLKEQYVLEATTPAYPARTFDGVITSLENRVDSESRTMMVRASIENEEDLLRPGMSFTTILRIDGKKYPAVPEIALQWSSDGSFVWIVRNNVAHRIKTQVISRTAGMVLIEGEVSEGEPVVVEGLERLDEGAGVAILGRETEKLQEQGKD